MIVVTGGAGFIGSAIIAALNKRGITDILIVDGQGCCEKQKNLENLAFTNYLEKNDFLQMVLEKKTPFSVETIFHMGAISSTTETNLSLITKNNYEYTKLLAQWAIKTGIRFIYASSAATYGDGQAGFNDNEEKLDTLKPLNLYGNSKHMFDLWARKEKIFDRIVGLKYFNVFGPNEYHKAGMRSFVLKAFEQINEKGKVALFKSYVPEYEDGEYVRDFIYIKDAVDMTLFLYDNPKVNGLFNIGTGIARTWNDLVKAVFTAAEKPADIEYIDMPESIRSQYQYYTKAEMLKLKSAGYEKQTTTLEDAVKDYVQNYLQKNTRRLKNEKNN